MIATNNTQAALGQIMQNASKRKSEQSGASFADVLVGQTKESPKGEVKSKSPDTVQRPEDAAKQPQETMPDDAKALEADVPEVEEEELEVTEQDASAYLMNMLLADTQVEAESQGAAGEEDLVILEGETAQQGQVDPSAVTAGEAGDMARMPLDGIPLEGMQQQDAEQAPQINASGNPSPLENKQKPETTSMAGEAVAATADDAESAVTNAAGAESDQNAKTDLNQQSAQTGMPQMTFDALQNQEYRPPSVNTLSPQLAQSVMNQTIEAITTAASGTQRSITIQLNPEFLGRMQMQLLMGEDGLTAKIRTSDPAVQATIAAQLNQLQEQLKAKGIQVTQVEVLLSTPQEQFMDQNTGSGEQFQQHSGARYTRVGNVEATITPLSMIYGEDYQIENLNGSVDFTA